MEVTIRSYRPLILAAVLVAGLLPAEAVTTVISFELAEGAAVIDPFEIANPEGGEPITITSSLTIAEGWFDAVFEEGFSPGPGQTGSATLRGLQFAGEISIIVSTSLEIGPISPTITAELNGPLAGTQQSDGAGALLGDGATSLYTGLAPFDVTAGPLACSDSFFGLLCGFLETSLELDFPLEIPALGNAPLPVTGSFEDLETPAAATFRNTFDFSLPLADNTAGVELDLVWSETGRQVVPEPATSVLAAAGLLLLSLRRRSLS